MKKLLLACFVLLSTHVFGSASAEIKIDNSSHSLIAPEGTHYQWFRDNEPLQGQRRQSLEVTESGNYSVEVVDEVGAVSRQEATVAVTATGAIIKIYTIGDSTVQDYTAGYYPRRGYGQELPFFFNTANVQVLNKGIGGTSSKSYYNNNWAAVKNVLAAGDFVFIAFGINDRNSADTARYAPTGGVFEGYLTKFINETKAKGGFPVLVTPSRRGSWQNGLPYDAWHDHPIAVRTVAENLGVPLIDLDAKQRVIMIQMGEAYIARYWHNIYVAGEYPNYPTGNSDDLHLQEMGAIEAAKMITEEIQASTDKNLKTLIPFLKPLYEVDAASNLKASDSLITRNLAYPQGVTVTMKVIPKASYLSKFLNWNDGANKNVSAKTLYTFTMGTAATHYTAMFKGGVVTGLEEENAFVNEPEKITFFPNPFTETLQMEGAGSYSIYDVSGIVMERGDCKDKCQIGQHLPSGMYVLEYYVGNTVKRAKVTKK
jgi:lysophospholipase L1-like esterase